MAENDQVPPRTPEDYEPFPRLVDEDFQRQLGQRTFGEGGPLTGGGDGGGGMEDLKIRVATLETHVGYIRSDVSGIKNDVRAFLDLSLKTEGRLSTIESELRHKPTIKMMWAAAGSVIAAILAATALQTAVEQWLPVASAAAQ